MLLIPLFLLSFLYSVEEDYHGNLVQDPYRYLEDSHCEETISWIENQRQKTHSFFDQIPERVMIKEELESLSHFEKCFWVRRSGPLYFMCKNDGFQNQNVIYKMGSLEEEPEIIFDPNILSKDGAISLNFFCPNKEGSLAAYGLSYRGSDWTEFFILDLKSKTTLIDHLKWIKFSAITWNREGSGFAYCKYEAPTESHYLDGVNRYQKIYFHKVGTSQEEDILLYERQDNPDWRFEIMGRSRVIIDDEDYLVIAVRRGCDSKNGVVLKEMVPGGKTIEVFNDFDASYDFLGQEQDCFWFYTDKDAPRGKIISLDLRQGKIQTLIPEQKEIIEEVVLSKGHFVVHYLKDAESQLFLYSLRGEFEQEISIPPCCNISILSGSQQHNDLFYSVMTFTQPTMLYYFNTETGTGRLFFQSKFPFPSDLFETKEVFYESKDGTKVPLFLTHKKGLILDGNNPVILYGYGGFGISMRPFCSILELAWINRGGVWATACLRGGNEYGEKWHEAGKGYNKQNVFDDFITAAEWLIENRYTKPSKLAIMGRSNGGLLVGASLTQRPELFGAAIPAVGVMDMLRFHKFTIGWAWTTEYGSSDNADEFINLYRYSPLHNIHPGTSYPPTLVITSDHDDRVVPAHSYKFAQTLQKAQMGKAPILIRINSASGHGLGTSLATIIDENADILAFLVHHFQSL